MSGKRSKEFRRWYSENAVALGIIGVSPRRAKRVFKRGATGRARARAKQETKKVSFVG